MSPPRRRGGFLVICRQSLDLEFVRDTITNQSADRTNRGKDVWRLWTDTGSSSHVTSGKRRKGFRMMDCDDADREDLKQNRKPSVVCL